MTYNRYPGVRPFEADQRAIFFGRDADIERLYEMILLERLVVLFGKSGYGKSSLLNAGVLPRFEQAPADSAEHYRPVIVRFGSYQAEHNDNPPLELVRRRLDEQVQPRPENAFLDAVAPDDTLWKAFKQRQASVHDRFLLVFDQFEEFFTYPAAWQQAFKTQLAELLYVRVPQAVRDRAEDLEDDDYDRLIRKLEVKAVFAIRSDRMSNLDQLSDALPAILEKRFELNALSPEQARGAIERPAGLPDTPAMPFACPPFAYSEAALTTILESLSSEEPGQRGIEAFQLQIICQYLERMVRVGMIKPAEGAERVRIQPDDLPDLNNIYAVYYRQQIALLPSEARRSAQLVIEEGLLSINEESGEARRLSVDGRALVDRFRGDGVQTSLLGDLVNCFLLRREPNTTGGFNYEISHDTLLRPIARSRQERESEERTRREAEARERAEAEARRERERREEAERLQKAAEDYARTARRRTRIAVAVALFAVLTSVIAWVSFSQAREARIAAQAAEQEAEQARQEAEQSLADVLEAQAREDRQRFDDLLARGATLEGRAGLDPLYRRAACQLYAQADSLYQKHRAMAAFANAADIIREKMAACAN